MSKKVKMHRSYVLSGALLLATGAAVAQETPKWEFAPAFEYVHTAALYGGQGYNCAGGGAGTQYNFSSMIGFVIDLNGCKAFGLSNEFGVGSKVNATQFSYLFGPRFTFRRSHMFQPFVDVTFGGILLGVNCNNGNLGNACGALSAVSLPSALPKGGPVAPTQAAYVAIRRDDHRATESQRDGCYPEFLRAYGGRRV